MRLAVLVALDGFTPGASGAEGRGEAWLHGALSRLGFQVVASLDEVPPASTLLIHVSGSVAHAVDSLRALSYRAAECEPESTLFLAELTHQGPPDDSLAAAEDVEAVREALGARERGQGALVAVRPKTQDERFAFTRLVIKTAVEAEDHRAARLSAVVERLGAMPERHTAAQGYAHVRGATDFELGPSEGPSYFPLLALADGARSAHEWDQAVAGYRAALMVARRPKDRAAAYIRIGAAERARGDLTEAKRAYEKAREHAPEDHAALNALVSITHDLGDWSRYVTLAREQVDHLDTPVEKADLLFAIARTIVEQSRDLAAAVVELEKARQFDPLRDDVLEALRRGYRVLGEWKKLIEVTGVLANEGPSDAERSARRFAQARIALDKLGDAQLAIAFLDAALTEDPTNDEALDVLVELRTSRGEVALLGRALEELAERYDEMGDTERAKDARRCIEGLPSVRSAEVARVAPPASSVYAAATPPASEPSLKLLEALPSAEDLGTFSDEDEDEDDDRGFEPQSAVNEVTGQMFALPPTLEELPPDSLLDYEEPEDSPSSAVESLPEPAVEIMTPAATAAVHSRLADQSASVPVDRNAPIPLDRSASVPAASEIGAFPEPALDLPIFLAGETGLHAAISLDTIPSPGAVDSDSALLELEESVMRTPLEPSLHARLFTIHTQAGRIDRAYLSALALEELGATNEEHEVTLEQCRPEGPLRLRALLDTPAWEALRAPAADDVIESLFDAVSSAAIAAQIEDRRKRRKLVALDPERKQSASSTVSIVASFHWGARVLGVQCPDLYVFDEVPGNIAAVPAGEPATAIGPSVLSGLPTKELAFLAARHLTYYRREYAPLVHFSSLPELTLLVLACVQMELPGVPIPQSVAASVAAHRTRIARHLTEADRSRMAAAVERLESRGGRLDLAGWVRSVELTSARAGLFLCGDLRSAMARLRADESQLGRESFAQARADIIAFASSRAHADLRAEFALIASPRSSGLRSREEVAVTGRPTAQAG